MILSFPAASLLLPGLAVVIASAGGSGELTRICAAVSKFLLFYSGVFALIGMSGAVAAGLLATDRIVMTPETRILSQALHRTMSLFAFSALANHVLLEILASRAGIGDAFIPFLAHRSTFFMGLGTISSDLFVLVIATGVLRRRFTRGRSVARWRVLHAFAYVAWPLSILHGLLAGRSAKPYVDWSYGACLSFAGLALLVRYVMQHRGRNSASGRHAPGPPPRSALPVPAMTGPQPAGLALDAPAAAAPRAIPAGARLGPAGPATGPMRALPAGPPPGSGPLPRMPRAAPPRGYPADPRDSGARQAPRGYPADPRDSGAWQAPRGYPADPRDSGARQAPRGYPADPRGYPADPRDSGAWQAPRSWDAEPGGRPQPGPRGGREAGQGGWDADPRGGWDAGPRGRRRRPAPPQQDWEWR